MTDHRRTSNFTAI